MNECMSEDDMIEGWMGWYGEGVGGEWGGWYFYDFDSMLMDFSLSLTDGECLVLTVYITQQKNAFWNEYLALDISERLFS